MAPFTDFSAGLQGRRPEAAAMLLRGLALTLLSLTLSGCPNGGKGTSATSTPKPKAPPLVQIGHAQDKAVGSSLAYTGSLESTQQAAVASGVQGILKSVTVQVGSRVTPGQVLAVVDDSQLDAQVAQAQASLMAAESSVQTALSNEGTSQAQVLASQQTEQTARAQLANAESALRKMKAQLVLAERNHARTLEVYRKDLIAAQSLDQTRFAMEAARADVDSASAQLRASQSAVTQAQAQARVSRKQASTAALQVQTARAQAESLRAALESAKIRKNYATITSPLEGVVISRNLDPGSSVSVSTPILVVASTALLRVTIKVNEADLADVKEGDAMRVTVDAYPSETWTGTVRNIAGGLDPSTRTLRVELEVRDTRKVLRPGMSARVEAASGGKRGLVLPLSAVVSDKDRHFVWVVDKEKLARRRPIRVLRFQNEEAVVSGQLKPDEDVIVGGVDQVSEDQPVKVNP